MPNEQNLIPMDQRSQSEARELGREGGRASGASRRRKRSLREAADLYLSLPVADKRAWNKLARDGVEPEDVDNQMAVIAGLTLKAAKGDAKAAKVLFDLLGEQGAAGAGGMQDMDDDPITASLKEILRFPYQCYDALICDGAVRSGKTSVMSLSFFLWAMGRFNGCAFALCGKSVGAVERNIVTPLLAVQYLRQNFTISYSRSGHVITARRGVRENRFYLFGGKDESSYTLIQGITLAGVLLDEVALMPRSFVEQAMARCSVTGAKLWFNCNPEGPQHWFRQEWILKAEEHKALHLHFTMEDNPALDEATRARYRSMYAGVFYQRYILGLWVMSEGLIYDMFDQTENVYRTQERPVDLEWVSQRTVACDYGTANPTVFLDIYDHDGVIRVDREYRWDSRKERRQKTDQEYADDLLDFLGREWCAVIVDPSAASFIEELRRRGVYVIPAENEVLDGIRKTGSLFHRRKILVSEACAGLLDELGTYLWDEKAGQRGDEKPLKERDHGPDALRYYINSLPDWRFE